MPHESFIRIMIQDIVDAIAGALNTPTQDADYAEVTGYNKLVVFTSYYGEPYNFEVVVRLPKDEAELREERLVRERRRRSRQKRQKLHADVFGQKEKPHAGWQHGLHIDRMPVERNPPASPQTRVDMKKT